MKLFANQSAVTIKDKDFRIRLVSSSVMIGGFHLLHHHQRLHDDLNHHDFISHHDV
jgi:hypothetical protein